MKKIITNILLILILISNVEPSEDNNLSGKNIIGNGLKIIAGSAIMYITNKYTNVKIEKTNNKQGNKPYNLAVIDRRTEITFEKENKTQTRYIDDKLELKTVKDFNDNIKVEYLDKRDIKSLKSKNENLGYEISILRKQNKELQTKLNYHKKLLNDGNKNLKLELNSFKNKKQELTTTLHRCRYSLKNANMGNKDLELKIENLEHQNKKLHKTLNYHRNLLKNVHKTLEHYKNVKNITNNNSFEAYNRHLSALEKRNNEIKRKISDKQKMIENLRLEERDMLIPILNDADFMGEDKSPYLRIKQMEQAQNQVDIIDDKVNTLINDIERLKQKVVYEKKPTTTRIVLNTKQKELEDNLIQARIICQKIANIS